MNNFTHIKPQTLAETTKLTGNNWTDTLLYAGGTDLLGLMKDNIENPKQLIDLKGLPNLNKISYSPGKGLKIGTLATIATLAEHPIIKKKYNVLAEAAQQVASPQLRNMGTIGGNLCQRPRCWYFRGDFHCLRKGGDSCYAVGGENKFHCIAGGAPCFIVHPSDIAPALMTLDASITIFSGKKSKQIPLQDFFVLPDKVVTRENLLDPGDIITEISIPDAPPDLRSGYLKVKERDVWDFATVSAAAALLVQDGKIKKAKLALGGVAPIPWLEKHMNRNLPGLPLDPKQIEQITAGALKDAEPMEQNAYKVPLARNVIKQLLLKLI